MLRACDRFSNTIRSASTLLKESRETPNAKGVQKQLKLDDLRVREYLANKYALWLDFRTIDAMAYAGLVGG